MNPIAVASGLNGQLELYEDKLCIKRKGIRAFLTQGLKGDKEIFLKQISSIQMKKPGLTNGYIQFTFTGGQETKSGLFGATQDENSIMFTARQKPQFETMKSLIEQRVHGTGGASSGGSGIQDLKALKQLRDEGIITEEEFSRKKTQILGL